MVESYEFILALCTGLGLAAACGFRVFVPLLVLSLAVNADYVQPAPMFAWVGEPAAVLTLSVATMLEIGAYFFPWIDNLLDSVATPAAAVAGTLATATLVVSDGTTHPMFEWAVAMIAGGGAALSTQSITVATRAVSTVSTAGVANPVLAGGEAITASLFALVAVVAPLAAVLMIALVGVFLARQYGRRRLIRLESGPSGRCTALADDASVV